MKKSTDLRKPQPEVQETMTPVRPPWWRTLLDYGLVALVFFVVNAWVQFSTPLFADTNDSFYHARMGEMITQGIQQTFPWLFFTSLHDKFVDHHLLFHMILAPFVMLGNLMSSMGLTSLGGMFFGPKLLISLAITGLFVVAYRMLRQEGIRFQWIWLLFLLCLPYDFFFRMQMIRVQSLSLLLLLTGLVMLWNKRFVWLGILSFAYVWLYGGFFFLPIFVLIYVVAQYLVDKELDLRPLYWTVGGVVLGFVLNPYFPKNFQFLYSQIFETGLGYQINVGGEWRPYDTWYIFQMGMVVFLLQFGAIVWSLIKGLKQNARSISLLVISLFFLILMFKSKRFVEYWPFFAVLSSAFMLKDYVTTMYVNRVRVFNVFITLLAVYLVLAVYAGKLAIPSITWLSHSVPSALMGFVVVFLVFLAILGAAYSYMTLSQQKPPVLKMVHELLIGALLVILPMYALYNTDMVRRDIAPQTAYVQGAENIMQCVLQQGQAQKGDIVFTDDWDIFPLFFFYNNVTNYIVGLDPVFMDSWNHELYEEFANITMGKDTQDLYKKITQDFQARFVVMDRDHAQLRQNIINTPGFTQLCDNGIFTAFKVANR